MTPVWMFSLASSGSSASTAPTGTISVTHRNSGPYSCGEPVTARQPSRTEEPT